MKKRGRKRQSALSIIKKQKVKHKEAPFDLNRIPVELWDYMIDMWGFYISRTFKEAYYKNTNFNIVFGAKFDFVVERDQLKQIHRKYNLIQRKMVKFLWIDGVILNAEQLDLIVKLFPSTLEIHVDLREMEKDKRFKFLKSHDIPSKITHITTHIYNYIIETDVLPISLKYLKTAVVAESFQFLFEIFKRFPALECLKIGICSEFSYKYIFRKNKNDNSATLDKRNEWAHNFISRGLKLVFKDKYMRSWYKMGGYVLMYDKIKIIRIN